MKRYNLYGAPLGLEVREEPDGQIAMWEDVASLEEAHQTLSEDLAGLKAKYDVVWATLVHDAEVNKGLVRFIERFLEERSAGRVAIEGPVGESGEPWLVEEAREALARVSETAG